MLAERSGAHGARIMGVAASPDGPPWRPSPTTDGPRLGRRATSPPARRSCDGSKRRRRHRVHAGRRPDRRRVGPQRQRLDHRRRAGRLRRCGRRRHLGHGGEPGRRLGSPPRAPTARWRSGRSTTSSSVEHRLGHSGVATDVAFSADGEILVTTSRNGEVRFWDRRERRVARRAVRRTGRPHRAGVAGRLRPGAITRLVRRARTARSGRPTSSIAAVACEIAEGVPDVRQRARYLGGERPSAAADAGVVTDEGIWQLVSPVKTRRRGFDDSQGHAFGRSRRRPRVVTNGSGPARARSGSDGSSARLVATDGQIAPAGSTWDVAGSAAAEPEGFAAFTSACSASPRR